jgi:hypothetical protein
LGADVDLGALKSALAQLGVNGRGWRLYLDYGDALFVPLSEAWLRPDQPEHCRANALAYLRLLQACEMDILPPPALVASLQLWGLPNNRLDSLPPLYFRAAWKAAVAGQYEQRAAYEFVREAILVSLWFFGSGVYAVPEPGLLKAGWPALLRRQKAWSLAQAAAGLRSSAPTVDQWNPFVRRLDWGFYRFEALTNEAQLLEEGEVMQHCVGTYAEYCQSGVARVYSVRDRQSGRRVATFSMTLVEHGEGKSAWECEQLSGVKNAEIAQRDMFIATDALLRAYQDLPTHSFAKPVMPVKVNAEIEETWCGDF